MTDSREVTSTEDGREIIEAILAHQNPDGSFVTEADVERFGEATARSGYLPKYRGTIWQAIFLAQLGAGPADPRIAKLGRHILDTDYSPEHKVIGLTWERRGRRWFDTMPCFVGNMVRSLSKLGFADDPRVKDSVGWLLRYQRFDDGDFSPPTTWPYHGSRERCFSAHSCYIGVTQAMKAMIAVPAKDRTGEVADFIRRGAQFILLHRVYQQSRGVRTAAYRAKNSGTPAGRGPPDQEVLTGAWLPPHLLRRRPRGPRNPAHPRRQGPGDGGRHRTGAVEADGRQRERQRGQTVWGNSGWPGRERALAE